MVDSFGYLVSTPYLRLLMVIKIKSAIQKVHILEIILIKNCYKEQYWELVKVFIFNYMIAHMVALILILVSKIDANKNWLVKN